MPASSTLNITNSYTNSSTTGTGGTSTDSINDSPTYSFQSGSLANQINNTWSVKNTLTSSAATYTMSALSGPGGSSVDFALVRKFWVHNLATADGNTIVVTPGSSHGWVAAFGTGGVTIPAGGCALFVAPSLIAYPVVATTTDEITVTITGTVPYIIILEGA